MHPQTFRNNRPERTALIGGFVSRAVAEFDADPSCRPLLGRLAKIWPNEFSVAAIPILGGDGNSPAQLCIAHLALRGKPICGLIADPCWPSDIAIEAFRKLIKADPLFDVRLARRLSVTPSPDYPANLVTDSSLRTLQILDEVSEGRRLVSMLGHLRNSADPKIASRAVRFLGKRIQRVEWVERQLERRDPRIRANAIEGLWGVRSDSAKKLLLRCTEDPSSRVVGNAVVGLHMANYPELKDTMRRLAMLPRTNFRAAVAWSLGKIDDSSITAALLALVNGTAGRVATAHAVQPVAEAQIANESASVFEPEVRIEPIDIRLDGNAFTAFSPEDRSETLSRWNVRSLFQRIKQ